MLSNIQRQIFQIFVTESALFSPSELDHHVNNFQCIEKKLYSIAKSWGVGDHFLKNTQPESYSPETLTNSRGNIKVGARLNACDIAHDLTC